LLYWQWLLDLMNPMEQSTLWEADSHSPSKEVSSFYGSQSFITMLSECAIGLTVIQVTLVHTPIPCFCKNIVIIFSLLAHILKFCLSSSYLLCVLHAMCISSYLIW
jgi:hypothetical protein